MANVNNVLTATDIHDVTTDKQGVIGQYAMTADGRIYRYAKAGAALAAGDQLAAPTTTAKTGNTKQAYKPGTQVISTAITATDADLPKFEDSVATISGAQYLVNGITKDGSVSLADKIDVAVANATSVSVAVNKFNGMTKAASGAYIGVAEVAVPNGSYFWARVEEGTAAGE